jgi:hypothetical protein
MKETFVYKQKMSFSYFYPVIVFVVIAGICQYFHYGIAWRNLRLLAYPNSVYVSGAIALLLLVFALSRWSAARKSAQNPHPITVDDQGVRFPHKGGEARFAFTDIEEIYTKSDEDDGNSLILYTRPDGKFQRYEFFEEHFENEEKFRAFSALIEKGSPVEKGKKS